MTSDRDKRYWLFAGSNYYPSGGMDDFVASSDSKDELYDKADEKTSWDPSRYEYDWYHILDTATGNVSGGRT